MSEIICDVCFRHCHIQEGRTGFCRARMNDHGINVCANYGRVTSLAMDPIEKKPLVHFYPGSRILSVGSYGCNFACPFCQNASISMSDENSVNYRYISAEELAEIACEEKDNLGIAFTYNEPSISYEYIIDTAICLKDTDKKIVLVSNGGVSNAIWEKLLAVTDAVNIDLKGDREYYKELHGDYDSVHESIALYAERCHVEVTSLIVPGKNDSDAWIEKEAAWLASLDDTIVLHLSRYFPHYHCDIPPTPVDTILRMQKAANNHLKYVYTGNI